MTVMHALKVLMVSHCSLHSARQIRAMMIVLRMHVRAMTIRIVLCCIM